MPQPQAVKITNLADGATYSISDPNTPRGLTVQGFYRGVAPANIVCTLTNAATGVQWPAVLPLVANNGAGQWTANFNAQPPAGTYFVEAYNNVDPNGAPSDSLVITITP